MKLDYFAAQGKVNQAQGLWLLHGDEPLLQQLLLDQMRKHWQHNQIERQRIDLSSTQDWQTALQELNELSLFASQKAIELHGNVKPDAKQLEQLIAFQNNPNQQLLVCAMPKQDGAAQKTAFFKHASANATVVQLSLHNQQERQRLLDTLAKNLQLNLTPESWQLLNHFTQNNTLAAHQALLRVHALTEPNQIINEEALKPALIDQSRFSAFDLADSALAGKLAQIEEIIGFLKGINEPETLVLWALAKEVHLMQQILNNPSQAKMLGIWESRLPLYRTAYKRLKDVDTSQWYNLLLKADQAIKGVSKDDPWLLITQLAYALAGVNLLV